ncbi:MAG: CopG family transcriptional regulator [Candidatus Marinimicrobia bacterium]|nr:CopG family transcriptional regulator [Candidatus Neomarinimicrobiota bacterium]
MEKHARINITLPETLEAELTSVSKELNKKKSHIIALALQLYFDELDTLIADKRYKKYKEGKSGTITLADLEKGTA